MERRDAPGDDSSGERPADPVPKFYRVRESERSSIRTLAYGGGVVIFLVTILSFVLTRSDTSDAKLERAKQELRDEVKEQFKLVRADIQALKSDFGKAVDDNEKGAATSVRQLKIDTDKKFDSIDALLFQLAKGKK